MRPEDYWASTPRALEALSSVYRKAKQEEAERWAIERAHFLNAFHFQDQFGNKKQWAPRDFLPKPKGDEAELDALTAPIEQEKARLAGMLAAARQNTVDPSVLPAVFQMTPQEAAARANKSNGRRDNR